MWLRRLLFMVVDSGRGPNAIGPASWKARPGQADQRGLERRHRCFGTHELQRIRECAGALTRQSRALALLAAGSGVTRLIGAHRQLELPATQVFIGRLSFDQVDAAGGRRNAVPTRFELPAAIVDEVIGADEDALSASPAFRAFKQSL